MDRLRVAQEGQQVGELGGISEAGARVTDESILVHVPRETLKPTRFVPTGEDPAGAIDADSPLNS